MEEGRKNKFQYIFLNKRIGYLEKPEVFPKIHILLFSTLKRLFFLPMDTHTSLSFQNAFDGTEGRSNKCRYEWRYETTQQTLLTCHRRMTTFQAYSITAVNKQQLGENLGFQTSIFIPVFSMLVFFFSPIDSSTTSSEGV